MAGLLHAFVPQGVYARHLSRGSFRSVWLAALVGGPLPLCSCGVIPTAMGLRRDGASRGAVTSFLIATPQTGADSIAVTWAMMGLPFAVVRPIAALVTALFGGTLANLGQREEPATPRAEAPRSAGLRGRFKTALSYAFVEMMADIGKWLVVGLVVAALISGCVPAEWFAVFRGNTLLSMLLVLAIAVPMYVCATGSIPIAVALMAQGLTPGAALVLLMAGPACNVGTMMVIRRVLGLRTLLIYLGSITLGAVAFGVLIDHLPWFADGGLRSALPGAECCEGHTAWWEWASAALLFALLANALLRHRHHHHDEPTGGTRYQIEGLNCQHCAAAAQRALASVEGVEEASVDLETHSATVRGTASREALAAAVKSIGFELL